MAKNDNLKDFLTDVADAISEKKGITEKINPQDFSDEIKSIKTSSSIWTGHVDVEGLKAIGWDDEDIAYYQEHGVNWMEEDDEYHKVPEDNKALYGVINADNYMDYKDIIVYLPKFDMIKADGHSTFDGFSKMVAVPLLDMPNLRQMFYTFNNCYLITCIPPLETSTCSRMTRAFNECHSLNYIPDMNTSKSTDFTRCFYGCFSLRRIPKMVFDSATTLLAAFQNNFSMECVEILDAPKINENIFGSVTNSLKTAKIVKLAISTSFASAVGLSKESVLFMIQHEAATEAITITLHAKAYARLAQDADILEALENHPLVTLVSA